MTVWLHVWMVPGDWSRGSRGPDSMKKVQWRERTDCGQRGGRKTAEKAINLERFVCRARDRDSAAGESIVSFRPNCSAISGVFFCAISPLGGWSAVTKGQTGKTQPGKTRKQQLAWLSSTFSQSSTLSGIIIRTQ